MDPRLPFILKQFSGYGNKRILQLVQLCREEHIPLELLHSWVTQTIKENSLKWKIPTKDETAQTIEKALSILEASSKQGIHLVTCLDDGFPQRLRDIDDTPAYVFYKGHYDCIESDQGVAIIGARQVTDHGRKMALRSGYFVGREGFVVYSGLAIGCDQYAHEGCLKAQGKTVAILPSGLDCIVPSANKELADRIIENNGCLLSEYTIGTKPRKNTYIERNRLQSGLSRGVLVIESKENSGTMHTVRFGESQGKIIACYQPPEKFRNSPTTMGTQLLIAENRAFVVKDKASLNSFMEKVKDAAVNDTPFKKSSEMSSST